jgi:hypothetical protein
VHGECEFAYVNPGYFATTPACENVVRGRWMHLSAVANPRSDRNDVRDCHAHAARMKRVPALRSRAVRSEAHRYIRGSVVAYLIPRVTPVHPRPQNFQLLHYRVVVLPLDPRSVCPGD